MEEVRSRKVLVVIGTGGTGLRSCQRLANGRCLVLAGRSEKNLKAALKILRSEGHNVEGHVVDVADYNAVSKLALVSGNLGQIDAIIQTAGVSPTSASSKQIFEINLLGTANVIEAFSHVATPGTSLVCIASMEANLIQPSADLERHLTTAPLDQLLQHKEIDLEESNPGIAYALSKRGVQLRVQGASWAWGSRGARLNSISPGIISTGMGRRELEGPAGERMKSMIKLSAAGRVGTPDDIVSVIAFLAGSDSDFIIGTDLLVDGGALAAQRWHT